MAQAQAAYCGAFTELYVSTGSKLVLPRTLAHMGLIEAKSAAILSSGHYRSAWDIWTPARMEEIHTEMRHLLAGRYPVYMFFESLFGTERAREVATDNNWPLPLLGNATLPMGSSARQFKRQKVAP